MYAIEFVMRLGHCVNCYAMTLSFEWAVCFGSGGVRVAPMKRGPGNGSLFKSCLVISIQMPISYNDNFVVALSELI